jgi:ATP diphosphatase
MKTDDLPEKPAIDRLIAVMAQLRDPENGCPWDLEQTFETIAPYTIEEAYEVADAIANNDMPQLREELGDLLLQVIYFAQMAEEIGVFDFDTVAAGICEKMIRRHPHVFGDERIESAGHQSIAWEEQKARERAEKSKNPENVRKTGDTEGALAGIAGNLPALTRSYKLQQRAARVGFDWTTPEPIFDKIDEELQEVRSEMADEDADDKLAEELGDVFFALTNLARHLGVDPEDALRRSNRKFERRFNEMEKISKSKNEQFGTLSLEDKEALWETVKNTEKS